MTITLSLQGDVCTFYVTIMLSSGMMGDMELMAVFAYGTLRPGHFNYQHIRRVRPWSVMDVLYGARVPGVMTHNGSYPYVHFDEVYKGRWVYGDVLIMDAASDATTSVVQMELASGYDLVEITARLAHGRSVGAYAFGVPATSDALRLPRVDSGNWDDIEFALRRRR